ncbi:MAG: hypothetical protein U9P14_05535 [Gemmatimonadota bacterium]|nr:hypothetical protein [Gemmatimonadota bacterium]
MHYANRNHVRAVELDAAGTALWYATTGGLVRLDLEREIYQGFGRSEGLPSAQLTGLVTLKDNRLLAGTTDLGLILRTSGGRWVRAGVFNGLPDDRVYCLVPALSQASGETTDVWVGTERGARKMSVLADYLEPVRGGSVILEHYAVYDVAETVDGTVYFATRSGLWRMSAGGDFTRFGQQEGLSSLRLLDVEPGPEGLLYINCDGILHTLEAGVIYLNWAIRSVLGPVGSSAVRDLRLLSGPGGKVLAVAAGDRVHFLDSGGQWSSGPEIGDPPCVIGPMLGDMPALGADGGGIFWPAATSGLTGESYRNLEIPGPMYNVLTAVAVDSRGTVWTSGASNATPYKKMGVSRFDGRTWTLFNDSNSPLLFNLVSAIDVAADDRVYLGTYFGRTVGAGGFSILDDKGTEERPDDTWESYVANDCALATGVIRGDIAFDASGGAWLASQFNQSLPGGLEYFDPARREFVSYSGQLAENNVRTVAVDGLGNVWIGYLNRGLGLLAGGHGGGGQVRQVRSFTRALHGETGILDLAVDQVNRLWIATSNKVVLLNFQEDALSEHKHIYKEIKPPAYAGLAANSIVVEGLGAVWFGTRSGVFRLETASGQWTIYNRGNSPLAADEVSELALDKTRGVLWAATTGGLSALSLEGTAEPEGPANRLVVRPNPWRPAAEGLLSISGIDRYSRVAILTVSGETVRRFEPRDAANKLLFWDGANQHGLPCASGVYLILAESPDGGRKLTGKAALIR